MPKNKIRGFIGVKSNDGHDAPILIVADILKKGGVEVILGGYDLTVDKFVDGIIQEGIHFAGISSYNGGHVPFFKAVVDKLKQRNYPSVHLIGGGGATITPKDIAVLEKVSGIDKIFRSDESQEIVSFVQENYDYSMVPENPLDLLDPVREGDALAVSGWINLVEEKSRLESLLKEGDSNEKTDLSSSGLQRKEILERCRYFQDCLDRLQPSRNPHPVIGIAGRGGSGKSTLTDELVLRYFKDPRTEKRKLALVAIDPSSGSTGGALLADRIAYMYATDKNWVDTSRVFVRSMASRGYGNGIARALPDVLKILKAAGFDVIVETYGIGQPDSGIVDLVDQAVFVATPDIGGALQIEKEEMLNLPGVIVVLNKSELWGSRHVSGLLRKKVNRDRLFLTTAIEHRNAGVDALYQVLMEPEHVPH